MVAVNAIYSEQTIFPYISPIPCIQLYTTSDSVFDRCEVIVMPRADFAIDRTFRRNICQTQHCLDVDFLC